MPRAWTVDTSMLFESLPIRLGDGGITTSLQALGLELEALPEAWNLTHPEQVAAVHRRFADAGAGWSTTNTFGANRGRLEAFGLEARLGEVCRAAVACARYGAPGTPVMASLGPVPLEAEALPLYLETVEALAGVGVDGFLVETVISLPQGCAGVRAAVEARCGPVWASFTPDAGGNLLDGTSLESAAAELFQAGASVVGVNCGGGPESLLAAVRRLAALQEGPVLAAPNAGLPCVESGRAAYALQPDSFARAAIQFVEAGASLVAGCCGVGPEHVRAAAQALRGLPPD